MHFNIRKAERCDHADLVAVEQACFDVNRYKWVMSRRAIRHHIENRNATLLVCIIAGSGSVAGYALALSRAKSRTIRFASLAVLPAFRGLGVGGHLIEAIEAHAWQRCHSLVLEIREDDTPLLHRYLALGYVRRKVIAGYHPDGGNALRLVKDISPAPFHPAHHAADVAIGRIGRG